MRILRYPAALGTVLLLAVLALRADGPAEAGGRVGLELMLRKLATVGTVMHATAHPDDEHNGLMALQSHGLGLRVVLATATRGNGGQNEIGPELFEALGVLRTEELLAAHAFDGAEQLFARAVDFGYSFSIEETFEAWGREETVGDYVRLIRTIRPDVLVTMRPDGAGGGQHHQASARIATEAARRAADPAQYPEQIAAGLQPWQPKKVYQVGYYGFFPGEPEPPPGTRLVPVDVNVYDPLLGSTYAEIGSRARAMHKCQGMAQLLPLPGSSAIKYRLVDTVIPGQLERDESSLTSGLDLSLRGLSAFSGTPSPALRRALGDIDRAIVDAGAALRTEGTAATVPALARGLARTAALREWLTSGDAALDARASYEVGFRLAQTARKFEQALLLAEGVRVEALADDGVVVPEQQTKLTVIAANRGVSGMALSKVEVDGFAGPFEGCEARTLEAGGIARCEAAMTVPAGARITEPYWHREGDAGRYVFDDDAPFGVPFRPTPFVARLHLEIGGAPVTATVPVQHRYEGNIFSGEKRTELKVVPSLSVAITPRIAIVPLGSARPTMPGPMAPRELRVTVTNNATSGGEASVRLQMPAGWTSRPAEGRVRFARADDRDTVRFEVVPAAGAPPGEYRIGALARLRDRDFARGHDVIEYPHTNRRHVFEPAATVIKVLEARLPEDLRVGYVMGVGDQVPPALVQLGARVEMLGEDDLAWGDLSRFDAIVTGVRAYERRPDLRAQNQRLLDYAARGGTVVVQYNKFEFNRAQYGPFAAKVSANRVTDERAPVTVLEPGHPVFTWPNRIGDAAWTGWVQERGLYFLGERDPRYRDLVELTDPFPLNAGPKRGALVEAKVGRGRWLYVGLGLWRQLPAGTDGAYKLLANIVSLGRAATFEQFEQFE